MTIISLDLSTKASGFAVFIDNNLVESGVIKASSTDVIERIYKVTMGLKTLFNKYPNIDTIYMEEVRPANSNESTSNQHTQKVLLWLQASIIFLLHDNFPKAKVEYLYPSEWRAACGIHTGRGVKRDTLKKASISFVKSHYNIVADDDESDAICIGYSQLDKSNDVIVF